MPEMKRLHALVPEENYDWLNEYSEIHGISQAESVRRAIGAFRYSEGKREIIEKTTGGSDLLVLEGPTLEEDTLEGLQKRMMNLELAFFVKWAKSKDPQKLPSSALYDYIPDYIKL